MEKRAFMAAVSGVGGRNASAHTEVCHTPLPRFRLGPEVAGGHTPPKRRSSPRASSGGSSLDLQQEIGFAAVTRLVVQAVQDREADRPLGMDRRRAVEFPVGQPADDPPHPPVLLLQPGDDLRQGRPEGGRQPGGAAVPGGLLEPPLGNLGRASHRPRRQRLHHELAMPRVLHDVVLGAGRCQEGETAGDRVEDHLAIDPHLGTEPVPDITTKIRSSDQGAEVVPRLVDGDPIRSMRVARCLKG